LDPLTGADAQRVQYEYGKYVIVYLSNPAGNGQQAGRGNLIGTRHFIRSARLLPNSRQATRSGQSY
jgi:hypothetical protein